MSAVDVQQSSAVPSTASSVPSSASSASADTATSDSSAHSPAAGAAVLSSASSASASTSASTSTSTSTSSSSSSRRSELPIRFGDVTKDNWQQLRRLHLSVFPTQYSDQFYKDAYQFEARPLSRLAYHNDVLIGAVCARIDAAAGLTADTHLRRLYIMTLGVLAPYRRHGIGRRLLQAILDYAQSSAEVGEVFLHVQTSNLDALQFYEQFGFAVTGSIPNYYKRLQPPDCFVVAKQIKH